MTVTIDAARLLRPYELMAVIRGTEKAAHDRSWPGSSRAPHTWRPGTKPSRSARASRCGRATTCSQPIAATISDRARRSAGRVPRRAHEQGHRRVRGRGRLEASDQGVGGDARFLRHRRRAAAACRLADEGFELLDAPIRRVAAACVPLPFADALEDEVIPTTPKVVAALRDLLAY